MTGREDMEKEKVMNEGSKKAGRGGDRAKEEKGGKMTGREDMEKEGDPIRKTIGVRFYCVVTLKGGERRVEVEEHM
jgi:hypothetical protein